MKEENILETLPIITTKFPCLNCGADQASSYNINEKMEVTSCNNCEHIKNKTHLESGKCWCHPELSYRNPKTGDEVWTHNQIQ